MARRVKESRTIRRDHVTTMWSVSCDPEKFHGENHRKDGGSKKGIATILELQARLTCGTKQIPHCHALNSIIIPLPRVNKQGEYGRN